MAYDPGAIDAALAAAVGDDPVLIAELRGAFADATRRVVETLRAAKDGDAWVAAAARLEGLAASFGAVRLAGLAHEAVEGTPHDPALLRALSRMVARF